MKDFEKIFLHPKSTVREAMENLSHHSAGIVLVVDQHKALKGVITDGDVRRGLLSSIAMDAPLEMIMSKNPKTLPLGESTKEIIKQMKKFSLQQMPIVDKDGVVVGVKLLKDLVEYTAKENIIFINAGGKGQRLLPLTENCPKPLLLVGNKPIMENIILNFSSAGFKNFVLSVNYMAEKVIEYFGDGSRWDVHIEYIHEDKPLGTAGAIANINGRSKLPVLVCNGDLLTNVDYLGLLDFHEKSNSIATICVREYDFQIPYGVVNIENQKLLSIVEKPIQKYFISAGIYVLAPEAINLIPQNEFFDMPTLLKDIISKGQEIAAFPIHEFWLDIGKHSDFEKAQTEVTFLSKGKN